jgi:RecA-family ATPase
MSSAQETSSEEPYVHKPFDIDVEQAVIGAIFGDGAAIEGIGDVLRPEHFHDPLHGRIFETLLAMAQSGKKISVLTAYADMKADPGVIETGGRVYFEALRAAAPAIPNVKDYANILSDLAARRSVIQQAEILLKAAHEPPAYMPTARLIAEAEKGFCDTANRARLAAGASLPILSAASLAGKDVPARQEFVEGLIPARTVTMLGGDGGTGKSLIAAQLATCPLTGATWLGRVVFEEGPVIFLSAEDELDELHRRFASIAEHQGSKFESLSGLHLLPLVGVDALLAVSTPAGTLEPTALFHAIEGQIRKICPRLVVLDNLSDVFGGDENSRVQARQFVTMLRRWCAKYDLTLVLLAHPSLSGMTSGSGTSGSTAWNNSVRSRLYLERVKKGAEEDDPDIRVLKSKKANYSRGGSEIRLRWDRGVFKSEGEGQSPTATAAAAHADRVFLDLVQTYAVEGRQVGATKGHGYAPAAFAEDKRAGGITNRALTDAMNRLFKAGKIRSDESGPPSRRRKFLVLAESAE